MKNQSYFLIHYRILQTYHAKVDDLMLSFVPSLSRYFNTYLKVGVDYLFIRLGRLALHMVEFHHYITLLTYINRCAFDSRYTFCLLIYFEIIFFHYFTFVLINQTANAFSYVIKTKSSFCL